MQPTSVHAHVCGSQALQPNLWATATLSGSIIIIIIKSRLYSMTLPSKLFNEIEAETSFN